ncbi:hypothetical protein BDR06DRAFT_978075 [Suillus hirtellus]|nr:hypothetical protein BDR06DRAFT_978075 [Suillus hirtellus]
MADDEENKVTRSAYVIQKQEVPSSVANTIAGPVEAISSDTVDDKGFWDVNTRIRSMVLQDFINSVGVQKRLQAKSKGKDALPPKSSKIRTPKLWATKTVAKSDTTKRKRQPTHAFSHAKTKVLVLDVLEDSNVEQPMEVVTPNPDPPAPQNMQLSETVLPLAMVQPSTNTPVGSARLSNPPNSKPTLREILHSIHDLGRWFDLLATNKWVDVLDAQLHLVEETLYWRLTMLEKWFSTLYQQWKATSSSLGNFSMALQKLKDNQIIHCPWESIVGVQHASLVDEEGVFQVGRQPAGVSTRRLDNAGSAPPGAHPEPNTVLVVFLWV